MTAIVSCFSHNLWYIQIYRLKSKDKKWPGAKHMIVPKFKPRFHLIWSDLRQWANWANCSCLPNYRTNKGCIQFNASQNCGTLVLGWGGGAQGIWGEDHGQAIFPASVFWIPLCVYAYNYVCFNFALTLRPCVLAFNSEIQMPGTEQSLVPVK